MFENKYVVLPFPPTQKHANLDAFKTKHERLELLVCGQKLDRQISSYFTVTPD